MDLEHTKLGLHCDVKNCHQRDFLPFQCKTCDKNLCLEHRQYSAHDCNGADLKNMTSMDCPLCGASVKFTMADNPDMIWEKHYLTSCTQQQKTMIVHKCNEKSCQINLGPSNTFVCGKCKQNVCLSHRIPEDHHCEGMRGAILSKLTVPPNNNKNTSAASTTTVNKKVVGSTVPVSVAPGAGTTKSATNTSSSSGSNKNIINNSKKKGVECPFCNLQMSDPTILQNHINEKHPENPSVSVPRMPAAAAVAVRPVPAVTSTIVQANDNNSNARAREVCPVCSARFVDPIELVSHFETAHPAHNSQQKTNGARTECALG
jgi:predicted nucleic acid binding AN1-type Zn finger protein